MPKTEIIEQVLNVGSPARKVTGKIIEPAQKTITLLLAKEQQMLKEAHISFF